MPVRSLNSSVLVWPNRRQVNDAVRRWALNEARSRQEIRRIGYFGSYARGDWGVGSDLDLLVLLRGSAAARAPLALESLPVPADALVYTLDQWERLRGERGRIFRTVEEEALWIFRAGSPLV